MKKTLFTCVVFSACLLAGTVCADIYWVSFNADDGHGIYLMQINETGKILKTPEEIADEKSVENCDCSTAIGNSGDYLYIWITNENNHLLGVYVDKKTAKAEGKPRILAASTQTDDVLGCTQNDNLPFLAYVVKDRSYRAYGVKSTGMLDGKYWRLSPRTEGGVNDAAISPDGEMSVVVDTDSPIHKIYAQPLRSSDSKPFGDPKVIGAGRQVGSVDVTNVLGNGLRLVVYGDVQLRKVFGQFVHPVSGEKVGLPKTLVSLWKPEEAWQDSLAIDPLGRFLLFTHYPQKCNNNDLIYFLPLKTDGTAASQPQELVGCSFTKKQGITDDLMGLDLLREP